MNGVSHANFLAKTTNANFSTIAGAFADCVLVASDRKLRKFSRGEIIIGTGIETDLFARVESGLVAASTMLPDGREFILEIVAAGGLIGELAVLNKQSFLLEYRAISDCELHFSDGRRLRDSYARNPRVQEEILSRAMARVSELEQRLISNAGSSLLSRLAGTILRLTTVYTRAGNGTTDELKISQHELAATLPASREKVNQCLKRLRECRVIDASHGIIYIRNRNALQMFANGTSPSR
ncbi:Crp/Fnr family transcriptional regulator [Agrobacterium sp.]|uniref:Crp/Fnr family transcriptional regulator n=1 Tax=Agrobacterium sp. TaxID=361 RepID=UPI0028AEEBD0|nr:Crp/Fnr family transcriptional regulator [Agrobacterium sp.]